MHKTENATDQPINVNEKEYRWFLARKLVLLIAIQRRGRISLNFFSFFPLLNVFTDTMIIMFSLPEAVVGPKITPSITGHYMIIKFYENLEVTRILLLS